MHVNRWPLAALFCLLAFAPAWAQQSFVTMRTSLRTDLTAESIAREAYAASQRIQPGESERTLALREVAEALGAVGSTENARRVLVLATQAAKQDKPQYSLPPLAPAYAQIYGPARATEFLQQIKVRRTRVRAGQRWVEEAMERNTGLGEATAALAALYQPGWMPEAEAQLALAYRKLGKLKRAELSEQRLFSRAPLIEENIHVGWAVRALIDEAEDARDWERAKSYLATYEKHLRGEEGSDFERALFLQALIEAGEIELAVEQLGFIKERLLRCQSQARLSMAYYARGEREKAATLFGAAMNDAVREGPLASSRVLRVVCETDAAGFRDGITQLFSETVERVKKMDPDWKVLQAGFLAAAAGDMAREDLFDEVVSMIKPGAMTNAGAEFVQTYARLEDLDALRDFTKRWLTRKDLAEMDYTAARAIRTVVWSLDRDEHTDRFRAELLEFAVDQARQIPEPAERALNLATLVVNGLTEPQQASATHPWNVPPTIAGGWETPQDPEPYAASLKAALGERPMPVVRAIRTRRLAFDPAAELIEIDGVLGALPYHFLLVRRGEQVSLFDGSREPVDALGATAAWRASDEALLDLVHFSISTRATKDGRFRTLQHASELEALREPGEALPPITLEPPKVLERTEKSAKVETNLLVAGQLERIAATVDDAGRVSLAGLGILHSGLPLGREFPVSGGFQRRRTEIQDAQALLEEDAAAGAYAMAHAFATGFGEGGWTVDTNIAWSWLLFAEESGHPHPFRQIGLDWRDGNGVPANSTQAAEWLVGSAKNGDPEAGLAAAELLLKSPSPERRDHARKVLQIGASAGHEASLQKLAELEVAGGKE